MQPPSDSSGGSKTSVALGSLNIPPRPALLMALQREVRKDEPDFRKIGHLLRRDAGMAGSLLKTANSAFYGAPRHVATLEDAITLVGMDQFSALMTGLITRRVLAQGAMMMARFWDVSEKRSAGMGYLARQTRCIAPELAYSFGLFCDIGIPLLKAHFATYAQTLSVANHGSERFTRVEDERHGLNHTLAGAVLADTWGIAAEVVEAIRLHHSVEALHDANIPLTVRRLIAANLLVDRAIQEFRGDSGHAGDSYSEWGVACAPAIVTLGLTPQGAEALCSELKERFAQPVLN
ncbi:MAG: HDOD domain-containing protein [Rhodocyclaceae bacterium]|nr:HDOD domain-containing protein [Rhodocyclaceae bacterium]